MSLFLGFIRGRKTMKLKYTLETVDMGDEIIVIPIGEGASEVHGILKINKEGREILDLLKEDTTEETIIFTLSKKYENDHKELERYVHKAIEMLSSNGLLTK